MPQKMPFLLIMIKKEQKCSTKNTGIFAGCLYFGGGIEQPNLKREGQFR